MVQIKEIINGVEITETIDGNVVVKLMSHQSKPFIRTTNETDEETYQIIDKVGEIYNIPAIATDFVIIDVNGSVFIPADGIELIAYSYKIRAFRPDDESDIFHIGTIETTVNSVTINLAGDGINWARIAGSFYEKYYPDTFNFTPVTTGQKILIIYAKPDSQVFHLAQGTEASEAVEPAYNGLFVARIIVDVAGAVVEYDDDNFKTKTDDTVYPIIINVETGIWVYALFNTFEVLNISTATTPILFGLISDGESVTVWNGKKIFIKNSSGKNVTLKKEPTPPIVGDTVYFSFSENITLKDGETAVLFLNRSNELELLKFVGGGGAELPPGTNGQIYEIDNSLPEKIKPSDRLTAAEGAITTETNARIAADKIETVVIALSPFNEDLLDNISRLGLGVLTFPLKVLSFQTSAFPVPTGSGITTDLRKNGTSVATSVISAGATNSTGNPPPTFSADTFAIGDRLNFFTPTGGVGSTVKGQNLVATLIIERL